ncbi:sulfite exporter TauE/SafE family protein [Brachybacterium saurashtrense]|uniref:Probable membrane transporter protein n=1 Tax=Brachybacterium saurashtrense TaxID=556288 RepID=A0A345YMD8_9MICO|nr:TSUP family transporter [Brachybacterium saurashtrense]AXK45090.1 sulfite exporter TauE/SafE family protein [Brachybacterium saurashtrense]RRR21774.1 sulfite exporter TauE/SafE family protein [Brachybacterium saurashtrense]
MPLLDQLLQLSALTLVLLVGAAFLAGWVDAVVGGGGLIQLPALLTAMPPDSSSGAVLGTNKLASAAGTAVSSWTYVRRILPVTATAVPLVVCALAGSAAGAAMASAIPKPWLTPIVLVALLAVGGYTLLRPAMGLEHAPRHSGRAHVLRAGGIGAGVGVYDGILGPGTGSFFIILMVAVLGYGFLEASVHAKLANLTTNISALAVFGLQGEVWWLLGAVLALANLSGGFLGARLALRLGSRFVRTVFLVVTGALALRLAVDTVALFT